MIEESFQDIVSNARVTKYPRLISTPKDHLVSFLKHILPATGTYCWFETKGDGRQQGFCDQINDLADIVLSLDTQGHDSYMACASFKDNSSRKQSNVSGVRSFWLDIDAGAGKPYADAEAAQAALLTFCRSAALPAPTVVCSGSGIHAYWSLDYDISKDEWQVKADALKRLTEIRGLFADPSRTADAASILRPVHTSNYKNEARKPVYLIGEIQPQLSDFSVPEIDARPLDVLSRGKLDFDSGYPNGQRTNEMMRRIGMCLGPEKMNSHDTLDKIRIWNQLNSPPLEDEKIVAAVTSIARRENGKKSSYVPLPTVNPRDLQGKAIPERGWIVPDWIPLNCTTAAYGDGGAGKSQLSMQLMTSAAIGTTWLGLEVAPVKALGFFCEDTLDELHRRQEAINRAYGCNFSDLNNMRWYSGVGEDNTLVEYGAERKANFTKLYNSLEREVLDFGARLIIVDTAADTFGGNENARGEVRAFIGKLNHLALKVNGAVVLCAHPSVAGMASGRGDGGVTAWNNSVRSRLYLRNPVQEDGQQNSDVRILSRMKANYAKKDETGMSLVWEDGVFTSLVTAGVDTINAALVRDSHSEECFLNALDDFEKQGRNLSAAKTSSNYAPKMMLSNPHCRGASRKQLHEAMDRLFNSGAIIEQPYGRGSSPSKKIARGTKTECSGHV